MKYILTFLICFIIAFCTIRTTSPTRPKFAAFVRVKDEINTVIPCLNSIDGLFDKIVIIHSNEPDDGSVKEMHKWCKWRFYCHIYEYPHAVYPSHTTNQKTIPYENSLAAYYNFGLEKFKPEEYVIKIDADQIYIHQHLKSTLDFIREQDLIDDFVSYGIKGYNTFSYHNKIVKYKKTPFNGGIDSFIIKRKYIKQFSNSRNFEEFKADNKIKKTCYWKSLTLVSLYENIERQWKSS
ncbi:MAG: hypothetical protein IKV03_02700 [Alphaproteobacteria bacterium]|nr:hypothetical protein [Alphaproteobacteria bacterium]